VIGIPNKQTTSDPINLQTAASQNDQNNNKRTPFQSLSADEATDSFKATNSFIYEFAKVIDEAGSGLL
jgi:hypothetical protein